MQQHVSLKLYKVLLVVVDILFELLHRVLACKTVGVIAVGQHQHLYVHTLGKQHVGTTHCRMDTGLITVVEQHDIVGELPQLLYLINT